MKIAVIEWAADDVEAPAVYVGSEYDVLRATAIAMYVRIVDNDECDVDVGLPHGLALDWLYAWHHAVREACTEPWVTFYDHEWDDLRIQPDEAMNKRVLGVLP